MILVILAIFIVILVAGIILGCKGYNDDEDAMYAVGVVMSVISCIATAIALLITIILAADCSSAKAIERKIITYELENAAIEERIDITVKEYLKHEKDVMTGISNEISDPMAVVMAYPELNSSAIVAEQIEVWKTNNNEIKNLKAQQIDLATEQWWLYFGGDEILESVDAKLEAELAKNAG